MAADQQTKTGKSFIPFLIVLYASAFVGGFNENLLNMALVSISNDYAVDAATVQWLVSGYMIVATVVVSCMAFLFRRVKLRVLFFAAVGFTIVGSVLGLAAQNFPVLLIARLIQSLGSGIFIPLMMNTVLAVSPKARIATFMSIGSAVITFGPAFAPVVTGGLVTALGWHSVFLFPLIAIIVIAAMGAAFVRDLPTEAAKVDALSVALSAILLTSLSYGLTELTIDTVAAAIAIAVAVASTAAFGVRQLRCDHPLIDLTPMRMRSFWPTLIMTTVAMMSSFCLSVMLPQYYEGAMGMEAFAAGLIILVPVLLNACTTIIAGRIMDRSGEWPLIPLGFTALLVSFLLCAFASSTFSMTAMFLASVATFMSVGFVFSPSQTSGLRTLPPEMNPFGVALNTTFLQIASCIGPSLFMGILSSTQANAALQNIQNTEAVAQGFEIAMIVAAGIAAVGLATSIPHSLSMHRTQAAKRTTAEQTPVATSLLGKIMETDVYAISPDAPVRDAMRALIDHNVSGIPLVDKRNIPCGFVSDGDIMRFLADKHPAISGPYTLMETVNAESIDDRLHELLELPVSEIATKRVITIPAGSTLKDACSLLAQYKLKKVPVTEDGKLVGVLCRSGVMRYAMESAL